MDRAVNREKRSKEAQQRVLAGLEVMQNRSRGMIEGTA